VPSTADLALWLMTTVVELFVVCFTIAQRQFQKFPFLNLYLMASIATNISRYVVFHNFGMASSNYVYLYYFTDSVLTLFLFLSICELAVRLVGTEIRSWKIILLCVSVLAVMAVLSFVQAPFRAMYFIVQFSENLFYACFFGVAALICFWGLKNRPADRIAGRLVTVLCVYFCLTFLIFRAHQYLPRPSDAETLYTMAAMAGAWLPLGCGFALVSNQRPRTKNV
jgi:peptidoglycan/LPS O-acetylase OafA/YrhL